MNMRPVFFSTFLTAAVAVWLAAPAPVQAQLVGGLELGLNSVKLNDKNATTPLFGRERGVINGSRVFFGSQRNWNTLGWIADFDYQTGSTDHVGQSSQGYSIATAGQIRVITLGATLNWPFAKFDSGSLGLAPRLGYRNLVRQIDGAPTLVSSAEDYQEGVAALGFLLQGEFERGFGVTARVELERPFNARQTTNLNGLQTQLISYPIAQWRPQVELSAWYRINPRHSVTVKAKTQDLSTGPSDSFDANSVNPNNLTSLPGQRIRMNSLRAAWAYHF
jgi:hypothetical protein